MSLQQSDVNLRTTNSKILSMRRDLHLMNTNSVCGRSVVARSFVLLMGVSAFSTITWAAGGEVSGFGGAMTFSGGVGTHGAAGAGAAYRFGDNIHLFGDFSYTTLASQTASSGGVTATGTAKLASFGGGFDYSFGSSDSKLRPYVTASLGVGHFYATGSGPGVNVSLGIANEFYTGLGGGVRLYVGKNWGIKPEVRYQRYFNGQSSLLGGGIGGISAVLYTGGIFYQFGK